MSVRARGEEVEKIIPALDATYAGAKEAASYIFSLCADLLSHRNAYIVAVKLAPRDKMPLLYGPFHDRRTMAAFQAKMRQYGFVTYTANLYPPHEKSRETARSHYCKECTHPNDAHNVPRAKKRGCTVRNCNCKEPVL